MKMIKAQVMGPMAFMMFQIGVSVEAESLMLGNLEWEEIPPMDEMGNPLPEWEASQARAKGQVAEKTTVSPATMVALFENMDAAREDHEKAKGSAFDPVKDVLLAALRQAENHDHMTVELVAIPMTIQESEEPNT